MAKPNNRNSRKRKGLGKGLESILPAGDKKGAAPQNTKEPAPLSRWQEVGAHLSVVTLKRVVPQQISFHFLKHQFVNLQATREIDQVTPAPCTTCGSTMQGDRVASLAFLANAAPVVVCTRCGEELIKAGIQHVVHPIQSEGK